RGAFAAEEFAGGFELGFGAEEEESIFGEEEEFGARVVDDHALALNLEDGAAVAGAQGDVPDGSAGVDGLFREDDFRQLDVPFFRVVRGADDGRALRGGGCPGHSALEAALKAGLQGDHAFPEKHGERDDGAEDDEWDPRHAGGNGKQRGDEQGEPDGSDGDETAADEAAQGAAAAAVSSE